LEARSIAFFPDTAGQNTNTDEKAGTLFLQEVVAGSTDHCNSFGQLLRWCHEF
jgi:hypothetical protein